MMRRIATSQGAQSFFDICTTYYISTFFERLCTYIRNAASFDSKNYATMQVKGTSKYKSLYTAPFLA